nr:membrane protein insertase YidC [Pyrinomonadaceae bacterium]
MEQKRLVLALILSTIILFGWQYLLRRYYPEQPIVETTQQTASNTPLPSPQNNVASSPPQQFEVSTGSTDATPQQTITVATPLYDVKLDSRGAVATSWVIKKNKDTERPLYSVAGDKRNPQPLELISAEGLRREPRETPLRLITGDASLDAALSSGNYSVSENGSSSGEVRLELQPGESKQVDFTLRDEVSGLDVTKSFTFKADSYQVDLGVKIAQNGQVIPGVKLAVGPS